ncbi:hypothetical protein RHMOL_Rhmol01G0296600 [Rhododendron molle]|uniref:Uncharacterized protein n=1 Tax=Rhododendron molle TaxID=49168 RepID=A0ACC0Q9L5_RHOML|nr:hypothetical protein RHMOL_Rhmol01G0296600 [Rhododendron molle]
MLHLWYSAQHPVSLALLRHSFECRDYSGNRTALFDGIKEGGIRASHEIDEHDNDSAMEGLQDRVIMLKEISHVNHFLCEVGVFSCTFNISVGKFKTGLSWLTGDIHKEAESHNRMLDRMGKDMDSSRGILSGTMDKFKMVLILSLFFTVPFTQSVISCSSFFSSGNALFNCFVLFCFLVGIRRTFMLVAAFVVIFLIIYYLTK